MRLRQGHHSDPVGTPEPAVLLAKGEHIERFGTFSENPAEPRMDIGHTAPPQLPLADATRNGYLSHGSPSPHCTASDDRSSTRRPVTRV
jgi:hypothetical protein